MALLRPLYQLYTNMTKLESEPGSILPPVTRALTELFLQVENLAIVSLFSLPLFDESEHDKTQQNDLCAQAKTDQPGLQSGLISLHCQHEEGLGP